MHGIHIQNQEIFDNPGNSGKASTIPAEFVSPENAGMVGFRHFRQFQQICRDCRRYRKHRCSAIRKLTHPT